MHDSCDDVAGTRPCVVLRQLVVLLFMKLHFAHCCIDNGVYCHSVHYCNSLFYTSFSGCVRQFELMLNCSTVLLLRSAVFCRGCHMISSETYISSVSATVEMLWWTFMKFLAKISLGARNLVCVWNLLKQ